MQPRFQPRRGFTLIELLVVIAIIVLLAAILIPAIGLVQRQQRTYQTRVMLDNLTIAVERYLADYDRLGEPEASGELLQPLLWLHHQRDDADRLLDLAAKNCLVLDGDDPAGPFRPGTQRDATHLADGWKQPIRIQVVNEAMANLATRQRTTQVALLSTGGRPLGRDLDRHLVRVLDVDKGLWRDADLSEIDGDGRWSWTTDD